MQTEEGPSVSEGSDRDKINNKGNSSKDSGDNGNDNSDKVFKKYTLGSDLLDDKPQKLLQMCLGTRLLI